MTIQFDGQVAIVTGAGRGIGRDTAIGLAKRGARVLVNDYGGGGDTMTPGRIDVAQSVVDEIVAGNGQAIADGTSVGTVESAEAIVGRAMSEFGRVDILVNNAGGSLGQIRLDQDTDDQVTAVVATNLMGPYRLVRQCWPIMKAQRYGRIVNIMSGTMLGMEGTAAYSVAKSGQIGLTNTAAIEGAEFGIFANGVWPVGLTRLAGKLEDPAIKAWMQQFPTSLVAEGIIYLCSSENVSSGQMFSIGGGRVGLNAFYGGPGFHDPDLTAESLAAHLDAVKDMSQATMLTRTLDENQRFAPIKRD